MGLEVEADSRPGAGGRQWAWSWRHTMGLEVEADSGLGYGGEGGQWAYIWWWGRTVDLNLEVSLMPGWNKWP